MKNLDFDCSTDGDRIIFVPPMWDDLHTQLDCIGSQEQYTKAD